MTATITINCPDHLKTVFDDVKHLTVKNDKSNIARDALMVWLASASSGVWVTDRPKTRRESFQKIFQCYPLLKFNSIKFVNYKDLPEDQFERSVVETPAAVPWANNHTWDSVRVLDSYIEEFHSTVDKLGLSLNERKEILANIRAGLEKKFDEDDLVASISRESLYEFIVEFWDTIVNETYIDNWHIKYLADELQIIMQRVFDWLPKEYDLVVNVPPGSTKSLLFSVFSNAWAWIKMPSFKFLSGSYVDTLASALSLKTRDLITSPKYQRTFPNVRLRSDQHAKGHFINTVGGSRYSFGVQGTVTGMHSHMIGIDDPLNPEKAVSEIELETANRVMSETLFTRKVNKDITPTVLIMQRLHQNDPTQHVLDTYENVKHIVIGPTLEDEIKPESLKQYFINGLMDPVRLSRKILAENFKALGEFSYAGQFSQRPVPRTGALFKPDRIKIDVAPSIFKQKVRYWDKAGSKDKGCYTAGVHVGITFENHLWILDVIRGRWAMEEREDVIRSTAIIDGTATWIYVEQEPGSGGKDIAEYTIRNLIGYIVQADLVGGTVGNKTTRAMPAASQVNGGNVYMIEAPWNRDFISELRFFPASKYKDQTDAFSGAVNKLIKGDIAVGAL